jgi:nucleotidyltransferase/DNA polymerase involved in DNA repair
MTKIKMVRTARSKSALRPLLVIPGVGKSIAEDLLDLGIKTPSDLKRKNPEVLYKKLCTMRGMHIDRCMLYVLRCAVYFAEHETHNAEKLKWWNWKD